MLPMTPPTTRDLGALPKGHLHVHLEGAMRPSTLSELAERAGIPVPEIRGYGSFTAFSATYLAACQVLQTPEDFARLVYEVVEDGVLDGAVWVEPSFYAPHHRDRFGTDEAIIDMVLDAAATVADKLGVGVGVMVAADRTVEPAIVVEQARIAARRPTRAWSPSGSPTTRRSGRRSPMRKRSPSPRRPASSRRRMPASWRGRHRCAARLDTLDPDRLQHGVRVIEDRSW